MSKQFKSIRAFVGSKNFEQSQAFYRDWGFEEVTISEEMSFFRKDGTGFYLQNYYVKDWIENTMLFLEVEDLDEYWKDLLLLQLAEKYEGVKLIAAKVFDWGKEGFIHDPSGVLWHIGEFNKSN